MKAPRKATREELRSARVARKAGLRATPARKRNVAVQNRPGTADGIADELRLFPADKAVAITAMKSEIEKSLSELARLREHNPFGNAVKLLALDLGKKLDRGRLGLGSLEDLVQRLIADGYQHRVERLAAYLGDRTPVKAESAIGRAIRLAAYAEGDRQSGRRALRPFGEFNAILSRELFGVVVTAHPTFSQSDRMLVNLAELAVGIDVEGRPIGVRSRKQRRREVERDEHRPPPAMTLAQEHALSIRAIVNIQSAVRRVYEIAFDIARELYPKEWEALTPVIVTVASWVGYDLDGRSDIRWSDTLFKRLRLQVIQLERYADEFRAIRKRAERTAHSAALVEALTLIESRLALAIKEASDEISVFQGTMPSGMRWAEEVRQIAKRMHDGRGARLVESAQLLKLIDRAVAVTRHSSVRRQLLIVRAEVNNHGLGLAHTHVRLNATQIHNAIRKLIGMETEPDDPARKRSYLAAMNKVLAAVQPVSINFASILAERTSAKRLFMIVSKMLKYIDATTPVRFLIAECESPLTLLAALYFAKYFGVEDRVDISPLFETTRAFERGVRMIDECLQNPVFAAYIRKRRRLCIQTGFSDAGRHLGQTVAGVSVEWFRLKLADLVQDRGFGDVEVVIFDTHGESIGRGGHPESFRARLDYIASPASRHRFQRSGIGVKEEASFQGGDGYTYFITEPIALASISWIVEFALDRTDPAAPDDPAYRMEEDYIKEFFITIRRFNERVMDDPDYATLLGVFGPNLLYPSGSRATKRQHDGAGARMSMTHPRQMRAIPHNGILQQLAYFANSIGGVGQAIRKDPERFQKLYATSPRFRRILEMAEWAVEFSDLEALKSYVDLFDPGQWLSRAYQASDAARAWELRQVAECLETEAVYERLARIYRVFQRDMLDLRDGLALLGAKRPKIDPAVRLSLRLMHAIRVALLMRIFSLSTHIPEFSDQHDISRQELISKIFHLEIEEAVGKLETIFPKMEETKFDGDFGEVATYVGDWQQTYEREHQAIFQPISNLYRLARRVSSGVTHIIGAVG